MKAAGKKIAAAQKKKGVGLFAVKTLSADLAAICGKNKMARSEVVKALWAYIKKNKLSKGRTITPDAKLKKVVPALSLMPFSIRGRETSSPTRSDLAEPCGVVIADVEAASGGWPAVQHFAPRGGPARA